MCTCVCVCVCVVCVCVYYMCVHVCARVCARVSVDSMGSIYYRVSSVATLLGAIVYCICKKN